MLLPSLLGWQTKRKDAIIYSRYPVCVEKERFISKCYKGISKVYVMSSFTTDWLLDEHVAYFNMVTYILKRKTNVWIMFQITVMKETPGLLIYNPDVYFLSCVDTQISSKKVNFFGMHTISMVVIGI